MHGRSALAKVVKVPVGTIVYQLRNADWGLRIEESEKRPTSNAQRSTFNEDVTGDLDVVGQAPRLPTQEMAGDVPAPQQLADLTTDGQEFLLCRGGAGGKGNVHFKSSRNRTPREYTEGEEGEQGDFLFELRTIADAGLVGYPNAGKSTLLRVISAARPKVASYPFTTLHPIISVVELPGYRRVTIADIPGLIEGAHRNLGLGHDFLRHITRCRFLLFVVDAAGSEGRNPVNDLRNLRREIDLYDPALSKRPWCIIANKIDLPAARENLKTLQNSFPTVDMAPVSASTGHGIEAFKTKLENWYLTAQDRHLYFQGTQSERSPN